MTLLISYDLNLLMQVSVEYFTSLLCTNFIKFWSDLVLQLADRFL